MMNQVYKRIIDFYGEHKQKLESVKKIDELIIGIMNCNLENVIEALADVYNMILQLIIIYEINYDEIKSFDEVSIIIPSHIKARGCAKEKMFELEKRATITLQLENELIFLKQLINQDLIGKLNLEKMVRSIKETKKYMVLYMIVNGIYPDLVLKSMDSKNQRTLQCIKEAENQIREMNRLKILRETFL